MTKGLGRQHHSRTLLSRPPASVGSPPHCRTLTLRREFPHRTKRTHATPTAGLRAGPAPGHVEGNTMNTKRIRRIGIGVVRLWPSRCRPPWPWRRSGVQDRQARRQAGLGEPEGQDPPRHARARQARHVICHEVLRRPGRRPQRLANYIEYWWPRGENWGIYNCRSVAGAAAQPARGRPGLRPPPVGVQREGQGRGRLLVEPSCAPTPRATSTPWPSASASRRSSGTARSGRQPAPAGPAPLRRLPDEQQHHRAPRPRPHRAEPPRRTGAHHGLHRLELVRAARRDVQLTLARPRRGYAVW